MRSASRSRSRERRKQERRERRAEKKQRNDGEDERGPDRIREEREYRRSLFPPGSDLSSYTFDECLFWYVTADKVWWYRPDLCLWYDSRSGSYYSYDEAARDYVPVEAELAVQCLADGSSCAPAAVAERRKAEEAAEAELRAKTESDDALRRAAEAEVEALAKARAEAAEAAEAEEAAARAAEQEAAARAEGADGIAGALGGGAPSGAPARDGEDAVAEGLHAHTESWQGKKDTQEDRYIQSVRLGRLGTVYGVFDGHGGVHAAEYVGKHLPKAVANCYQQRGGNGKKDRVDGKRMLAAMEDAFPITDRELLQQARRKGSKDGTTALLMLVAGAHVDELTLYLSHVGDCRAVLCRGTSAVRLTQDHRPDRKDEQKRIRVNGSCNQSAAALCSTALQPPIPRPCPGPSKRMGRADAHFGDWQRGNSLLTALPHPLTPASLFAPAQTTGGLTPPPLYNPSIPHPRKRAAACCRWRASGGAPTPRARPVRSTPALASTSTTPTCTCRARARWVTRSSSSTRTDPSCPTCRILPRTPWARVT